MTSPDFSKAPWRAIDAQRLATAAIVPTMLPLEEQKLYYWLARERIGGPGAIADLGSFVGGSAARLGQGLEDGGWYRDIIHLYDRFTANEHVKARLLYPGGVAPFEGNDIYGLSHDLLFRWAEQMRWHRGEIATMGWPDDAGEIRLMMMDICKTPADTDHVTRTFLPHLRRGGVVNQQDMLQWDQPWTAVAMLLLTDWLTPIGAAGSSLLFRCERVPTAADMRHVEVSDLDDNALIAGLAEARKAFAAFVPGRFFDRMIAGIRANPGVRKPWMMKNRPPQNAPSAPQG